MHVSQVRLANGRITGELTQSKSTKLLFVLCHGYQDSRNNTTIVAVADMLNQNGYTTLTFNFSPNTGGIDIEQQVSDILYIVNHYKNNYAGIVLLAASFAALSASIATIKSPDIKGLITLSGFFGTGELGGRHRRIYLEFRAMALVSPTYRKIYHYFKRELRPARIKSPALVIHSQADTFVSIAQSQRFYAQLTGPKQFIILKHANHGITAPEDRQEVVQAIHDWVSTKLR